MKKMYFLAAALLVLLFAACSKDHVNLDDDDGLVTSLTGDAWVSINVSNKSQGRALHDPNYQMGTPAETTVGEVRAIFFDENGAVTEDKILSTDEAGTPGQATGSTGKAFQVPAKSKSILIITNPVDNLPAKGSFANFTAFNKAINELDVSKVSTANKFMMTNAKGGLEPHYEDLRLYNSAEKAQAKPLAIRVDRVVAKVRVYLEAEQLADRAGDAIPNVGNGATIYDPEWTLNVRNKWYFPVSERVYSWVENKYGCESPFDQYDLGSYRIDPNYDTQIDPEVNKAGYDAQYHYFYDADAAIANKIPWKSAKANNTAAEYCLENTQTEEHNDWAYTTQVLFKVVFMPNELKLPNSDEYYDNAADNVDNGELAFGEDWIMLDGGYYTWDLLMKYIEVEMESRYYDQDADEVNTPIAKALNVYLKAIGLAEVDIPAFDEHVDPADQIAGVMDDFVALKGNVKTHGADRHGVVTYYKGGVNYYPIMIKHDDTEEVDNEFGEFGVVRNSVYDIRITKVFNPGYPTIPDPNPNIPDETGNIYLAVRIDINPWTWYSQVEQL